MFLGYDQVKTQILNFIIVNQFFIISSLEEKNFFPKFSINLPSFFLISYTY